MKRTDFHLRRSDFLFFIIHKLGFLCFHSIYRIRVEGRENLPSGAAVVLPKHQFWTDIPLVGLALEKPASYVAKHELFVYPVARHFLTWMGGIPINRLEPVKTLGSFRYVEKLLKTGEKIILFPEGTYYPDAIGAGKHGFVQAILHFQKRMTGGAIPFLPMGIRYTKRGLRTQVCIRIGAPVFCRDESQAREFTECIVDEIGRLSGL